MSIKVKHFLWTNSTRRRYFLIPDSEELLSGDLTIQTLAGEMKQVSLTAIAPFEISREQAKPYIQAELNQALQQATTTFSTFANFAAAAKGQTTTNVELPQPRSNSIATLLGISPEELRDNPEAVKQGWQNLFTGINEVIQGATSEDPAHLEAARTRMHQLRQHLQSQGVEVNESIENLPNKLREKYLSSETEPQLKESAAKLQETTQKVEQSFTALLQTLKEGAAKLQKLAEESKD